MSVSLMTLVPNSVTLDKMTDAQVATAYRQGKAFREETARWADLNDSHTAGTALRAQGVIPVLRSQGVLSLCLDCGTTMAVAAHSEASRVAQQRGYATTDPYVLQCCGTVFLP